MDEPGLLLPLAAVRDLAEIKKIVLGSSRPRSSKFRRRRGGGGGGIVKAAGLLVRPHAEIPGIHERELGDISAEEREAIDPLNELPTETPIYEMFSGTADVYEVWQATTTNQVGEIVPIGPMYAVPKLAEGGTEVVNAINMARLPIKPNKLCQAKSVDVGGQTLTMIDVDPC